MFLCGGVLCDISVEMFPQSNTNGMPRHPYSFSCRSINEKATPFLLIWSTEQRFSNLKYLYSGTKLIRASDLAVTV